MGYHNVGCVRREGGDTWTEGSVTAACRSQHQPAGTARGGHTAHLQWVWAAMRQGLTVVCQRPTEVAGVCVQQGQLLRDCRGHAGVAVPHVAHLQEAGQRAAA